MQQTKKTIRIYALAKKLGVDSKDILDLSRELGFDVKNQLSSLDEEQEERVKQRLRSPQKDHAAPTTAPPPPSQPSSSLPNLDSKRVPDIRTPRRSTSRGDTEQGDTERGDTLDPTIETEPRGPAESTSTPSRVDAPPDLTKSTHPEVTSPEAISPEAISPEATSPSQPGDFEPADASLIDTTVESSTSVELSEAPPSETTKPTEASATLPSASADSSSSLQTSLSPTSEAEEVASDSGLPPLGDAGEIAGAHEVASQPSNTGAPITETAILDPSTVQSPDQIPASPQPPAAATTTTPTDESRPSPPPVTNRPVLDLNARRARPRDLNKRRPAPGASSPSGERSGDSERRVQPTTSEASPSRANEQVRSGDTGPKRPSPSRPSTSSAPGKAGSSATSPRGSAAPTASGGPGNTPSSASGGMARRGDRKPAATPNPSNVEKTSLKDLTPEQLAQLLGGKKVDVEDRDKPDAPTPERSPLSGVPPGTRPGKSQSVTLEEDEEGKKKGPRPGRLSDREQRQRDRAKAAQGRRHNAGNVMVQGGQVVVVEEEGRSRRSGRGGRSRPQVRGPVTKPRIGKVPIDLPITVRTISEAIGRKVLEVLFKLKGYGFANPTINTTVDEDTAHILAADFGVELEVRKAADVEDEILELIEREDPAESLQPRAPVVTIMGHVDHGKTSLLDHIRRSNVVATETGGITQVIRAWRVYHQDKPVTFLDTPGHEAFTAMRARGANVTDIAIIVVAADDGIMPQTEEAINHAKAAEVPIVVAINKIDLPNANLKRTEQQLYGMGLIPDTMGGDSFFCYTSAATGEGIDELLETLSLVAEIRELKANPDRPADGICLEAHLSSDQGVLATMLVQRGTLHQGDVVLVGSTHGRVRAMFDDLGRPIEEAGPSVPVQITGLDNVPQADDPFVVVEEISTAREIADRRRARDVEASMHVRPAMRLESIGEKPIDELKVILKADFRGSIEAIRKELEKLTHEEVRVRVLHTGIGGITESDVQLALTSPEDTIIVGFNAVPDDKARVMAEARGIQIREYSIIYNLTNDIKAALEGKLKPIEEVIHLGRAVVRETFKISRVGTVAGCYVTQGVIERTAKIKVIRGGIVIYPPPERTASLESLKRFKDDAKEVREGFECGIKIAGYDDIKVDDVIEAYRIEEVQRTL